MSRPKFRIERDTFLKRLKMDLAGLDVRLDPIRLDELDHVLPLRSLRSIEALRVLPMTTLEFLIRSIPTLDGQIPYRDARIVLTRLDPIRLLIGQKFIFREKYQTVVEGIRDLFAAWAHGAGGYADLGAYAVFGYDIHDKYVLALYIPPIVEIHSGGKTIILDGIHRSYMARQAGIMPTIITVEPVTVPFPCLDVRPWSEVKLVPLAERPALPRDRYFGGLEEGLFRDLFHLGIDG